MQSWLQKQGRVWVAKFAGILRFYRKAVVLISATSPLPLPRSKRLSKIADEAREKERFVHVIYPQENWRVPSLSLPPPPQLERPLRPATATGLFNFVHKSVMEEPLQALPIRNEACRVTMLSDKGFLSLRWPCRTEKLWTFACWVGFVYSLFFHISVFLALSLSIFCQVMRSLSFYFFFFFLFFCFLYVHHFCKIGFEFGFEIESSILFINTHTYISL